MVVAAAPAGSMSTLMLRTSSLSLNPSCYYNHHSWQGREKQGHPSRTAMIVMAKNRGPAVEIGKSAAANVPICTTATPSGTSRDIEETAAASSVAAAKLLAKNLHQHQQAMNSSSNSSSSSSRSTTNNKNNHSTTTSTRPQQLQKTATNIRPSPAAAWACDSLERALVKIFAGSDIGGVEHSDHDRKHSSNFFLNGYFEPVAHETSPVSNLPVSGSIPVSLVHKIEQTYYYRINVWTIISCQIRIANPTAASLITYNSACMHKTSNEIELYEE
jgi:hypothetical protein